MSPNEIRTLIRREFEEAWEGGNHHVIHETSHGHRASHRPAVDGRKDVEGIKAARAETWKAFTDHKVKIEHLIVEGNMAAARITLSGKHTGEVNGVKPTGKEITVTANGIYRIEDGKIVEDWTEWDNLSIMRQLGLAPQLKPA